MIAPAIRAASTACGKIKSALMDCTGMPSTAFAIGRRMSDAPLKTPLRLLKLQLLKLPNFLPRHLGLQLLLPRQLPHQQHRPVQLPHLPHRHLRRPVIIIINPYVHSFFIKLFDFNAQVRLK